MTIENLKSQLDLLKILARPKSKYRKLIIQSADKKLVQAICECIHNVLKGNINISESEKKRLKSYRSVLHELIKKSTLKTKKKILIQRGGFLEVLLPAVISGIASIISSAISSS